MLIGQKEVELYELRKITSELNEANKRLIEESASRANRGREANSGLAGIKGSDESPFRKLSEVFRPTDEAEIIRNSSGIDKEYRDTGRSSEDRSAI